MTNLTISQGSNSNQRIETMLSFVDQLSPDEQKKFTILALKRLESNAVSLKECNGTLDYLLESMKSDNEKLDDITQGIHGASEDLKGEVEQIAKVNQQLEDLTQSLKDMRSENTVTTDPMSNVESESAVVNKRSSDKNSTEQARKVDIIKDKNTQKMFGAYVTTALAVFFLRILRAH